MKSLVNQIKNSVEDSPIEWIKWKSESHGIGDNTDELDCSALTKIKIKRKYEHM